MTEEDYKNIIDELTEQLKTVSLERAIARADVRKAVALIKTRDEQIEKLQLQASAEIQTVKTEE